METILFFSSLLITAFNLASRVRICGSSASGIPLLRSSLLRLTLRKAKHSLTYFSLELRLICLSLARSSPLRSYRKFSIFYRSSRSFSSTIFFSRREVERIVFNEVGLSISRVIIYLLALKAGSVSVRVS